MHTNLRDSKNEIPNDMELPRLDEPADPNAWDESEVKLVAIAMAHIGWTVWGPAPRRAVLAWLGAVFPVITRTDDDRWSHAHTVLGCLEELADVPNEDTLTKLEGALGYGTKAPRDIGHRAAVAIAYALGRRHALETSMDESEDAIWFAVARDVVRICENMLSGGGHGGGRQLVEAAQDVGARAPVGVAR